MKTIDENLIVENLLFPIWQGLDSGYKDSYKMTIWEQFENGIRSAAYTAKLSIFLENIKRQLPITIPAKFAKAIESVVCENNDKAILNLLREETTFLVLKTRIANQERRDQLLKKWEKQDALDQLAIDKDVVAATKKSIADEFDEMN